MNMFTVQSININTSVLVYLSCLRYSNLAVVEQEKKVEQSHPNTHTDLGEMVDCKICRHTEMDLVMACTNIRYLCVHHSHFVPSSLCSLPIPVLRTIVIYRCAHIFLNVKDIANVCIWFR